MTRDRYKVQCEYDCKEIGELGNMTKITSPTPNHQSKGPTYGVTSNALGRHVPIVSR